MVVKRPVRIVVTGAHGLLGFHASARLYAANCAARFKGELAPYELIRLGRSEFSNTKTLQNAVAGADAVLHFAGVNKGDDTYVEKANPDIAEHLAAACKAVSAKPHIVYANTIHAQTDTPYGCSKRKAGEKLSFISKKYTNLILPHIFGECAKPFYNNVTATFIQNLIDGQQATINPDGSVHLLHAGSAAQAAIDAVMQGVKGDIIPDTTIMRIPDLWTKLQMFHDSYMANVFPDLSNDFDVTLFNSYRAAGYPKSCSQNLTTHNDDRGMLFETVKGGGGGQSFISMTKPSVTRGDHFHISKVERFVVLQGEAIIRIRKVFERDVVEYRVSGQNPTSVDMPTLHTHSIQNIGDTPLTTLFWTHDLFDPKAPDTYADKVLL